MKDLKQIEKSYKAYVYICYLHGNPVYVGKGTGKRYLHCKSGRSNNFQLNQALFTHGVDSLDVQIPCYNLSDDEAFYIERKLINSFLDDGYELFNCDTKTLSFITAFDFFGSTDISTIPDWVTEEIE